MEVVDGLRSLKTVLSLKSQMPSKPSGDADSGTIKQFAQAIDKTLQSLDRERIEAMQQVTAEKLQIGNLKNQLASSIAEVASLNNPSLASLESEQGKLVSEDGALAEELRNANHASDELNGKVTELLRVQDRLTGLRKQLEDLGDEVKIHNDFDEANQQLTEMSSKETELRAEHHTLTDEIHKAEHERSLINATLTELTRSQDKLSGLRERLDDRLKALVQTRKNAEKQLESIQEASGDETNLKESIGSIAKELTDITRRIEQLGSLQRLLFSAEEYIEDRQPNECPVCEQQISPSTVLDILKRNLDQGLTKETASLKIQKKTKLEFQTRLEQALDRTHALKHQIDETEDEEKAARESFQIEMARIPDEPSARIESSEAKHRELTGKITTVQQRLEKNEADLFKTRKELDRVNSTANQLANLKRQIANAIREQSTIRDSFQKKTGIIPDNIPEQVRWNETQLREIEQKINNVRIRASQLEKDLSRIRRTIERINSVRKRLEEYVATARKILHSEAQEDGLLKEIELRLTQLGAAEEKLKETGLLDELARKNDEVKEANAYLEMEEELEALVEELPKTNVIIDELEVKVSSLKDLEASILAIREVAAEYAKQAVTNAISSLEDSFNDYYRSLSPHGYFTNLQVSVEKGEPPIYSIRAVSKDQSTYIPTRFSNAQMNAAAIALFLARNARMTDEFKTILLDDPTQSMDEAHRASVCNSVSKLLKGRQVILATQDEEIMKQLKNSKEAVNIIEFSDWTPAGPTVE